MHLKVNGRSVTVKGFISFINNPSPPKVIKNTMRCESDFEYGDIVVRRSNGFTITGATYCRVIAIKEKDGEKFLKLEIASLLEAEKDPELAKILAEPDAWHKACCGWELA